MKEGFELKSFKNYNVTPAEQIKLDKFLKENLEKGYIRPSQSPMASPFFFVNKKDRKLWPCQDYWYLNDWTIKNSYSLPLISEIMDKLKGTKYFTKLHVHWGYNNIQIKKGDEWKAAFKMNKGLFKPTIMFFGMCNSPATFQAMMDNIFVTMKIGDCLYGWYPHICWNKRRTYMDYKNGTGEIIKKWFIPKSQEMQILRDEDQISRHDHWRRKNLYEPC